MPPPSDVGRPIKLFFSASAAPPKFKPPLVFVLVLVLIPKLGIGIPLVEFRSALRERGRGGASIPPPALALGVTGSGLATPPRLWLADDGNAYPDDDVPDASDDAVLLGLGLRIMDGIAGREGIVFGRVRGAVEEIEPFALVLVDPASLAVRV